MKKLFLRRQRPLVFSLCAMTFLCLLLLVLYGLAEKENAMLKEARSELFLSLAISEAEEAEAAWQEKRPTAELYHHITAAADYLSMTTQTENTRQMTLRLRGFGDLLLHRAETEQETKNIMSYPWQELPTISQDEGIKTAETITQTKKCLHPALGRYYIYTCKNVYVKLSQNGGVPLEIAVYTPVREDHPYTVASCVLRSRRFLEEVLPHRLSRRDATSMVQTETGYRIWYPCGTGKIWVDVRSDTGRIVGLRFVPEKVL